jgi:hypothetical protein
MSDFLFPCFLSNAAEYGRAEAYWKDLWRRALEKCKKSGEWRSPWLTTRFADGTVCRDGNPIFSAVNETKKLGIRIIQHAPSNAVDLDSWTDEFGDSSQGERIRELVISCVPTQESATHVLKLLCGWVTQEASAA